jgi:L-asparaginase
VEGATNFARKMVLNHFQQKFHNVVQTKKSKIIGTGTVGCAFDQNGKIAAATSTGGKGFEVPGRISDSATVAGIC